MTRDPNDPLHPQLAPEATAGAPQARDAAAPLRLDPDPVTYPEALAEAHTRVKDAIEGYRKLHEKAASDLAPVTRDLLALHEGHEAELAAHLVRLGHDPAADGSIFATINRVAIEVRSWFDDMNRELLESVKEGEKHVLDAYQTAARAAQTAPEREMLARHIREIDAVMWTHAA